MEWMVPKFTRGETNRAGQTLVDDPMESPARQAAVEIVNNWRAAHGFALNTFQVNLRKRAKRMSKRALVSQRLKRIVSVEAKLRRAGPASKLTQMQDIGGCRAVLTHLKDVIQLAEQYKALTKEAGCPHSLRPVDVDDYIARPKPDGYRSIHLSCRYKSVSEDTVQHDGRRIEIQLRTRMQHAWATTVETASAFTGQDLKSDGGDPRWRRFFALMSWLIAWTEDAPPVPGLPTDAFEIIRELRQVSTDLNAVTFLRNCGIGVVVTTSKTDQQLHHEVRRAARTSRYFVIDLDTVKKKVVITTFGRHSSTAAQNKMLNLEKEIAGDPSRYVLLAKADSIIALRRAYPSYYADTTLFLGLLKKLTEMKITE